MTDHKFRGFDQPNYTQVPNQVFDELMPVLTDSEFKVLCYVARRTFGFGKASDAISVTQMERGIVASDGRVIDGGTGLSRTSIRKATASLVERGVLNMTRVRSDNGEYETNIYSLRFAQGVGQQFTDHRSEDAEPVGQNLTTQKTVKQKTEIKSEDLKMTLAEREEWLRRRRAWTGEG